MHLTKLATAALLLAASTAASAERPLLITVDDLPLTPSSLHPEPGERERITRALLEALAKHEIRAVGFVTWRNVTGPADERLLEMWLDAGHELGNHSWNHPDYRRTPIADYVADMERARVRLDAFLKERGSELRFFRFPYLREGESADKLEAMRAWLGKSGQQNLPPTLDTQDWSFALLWTEARRAGDETELGEIAAAYLSGLQLSVRTQEALSERLFERPVPEVLLLHANEVGAGNWPALFDWLAATGHRFVDADTVLRDPALTEPHDYLGEYGPGLWYRLREKRDADEARAAIDGVFADSVTAWNRGDYEAFCEHYAEDARYLSSSGVTEGRAAVLASYRERYPDRAAMGTLSLEVDSVRFLGGTEVSLLGDAIPGRLHAATVAARWRLERAEAEPASGRALLVLHRRKGRWLIVEDATF